uniref:Uncharacterized protein n=1 Tax=viral metagenome TaxID=1070528 RepID=A0A6C0BQW1_9ZZZZ
MEEHWCKFQVHDGLLKLDPCLGDVILQWNSPTCTNFDLYLGDKHIYSGQSLKDLDYLYLCAVGQNFSLRNLSPPEQVIKAYVTKLSLPVVMSLIREPHRSGILQYQNGLCTCVQSEVNPTKTTFCK